jgi:hypothetical protein
MNGHVHRFNLLICRFRLSYRLILREKELHFNIGVYNPSKDVTFSFHLLLHTYFKCPDVRRCQITGLQGCTFVDKVTRAAIRYDPLRDFEDDLCTADERWSHVSRRSGSSYRGRIYGQNLPEYAAGAHHHQRGFRPEDAHPEI